MPTVNMDSGDAKRKEFDKLTQNIMEATNTIIELEAKLLHAEAQLKDKRALHKDERIMIEKFLRKEEDSIPMENKALVKSREEDVKGMHNLLKRFEESTRTEIKQIYSETVVPAEVAGEMGHAVDDNSEIAKYFRWLKENISVSEKEKAKMKQKFRQHLKTLD